MVNGFKKRKILADKSLGEFLKDAREEKELSIEDAEVSSRVKAKYLIDIEAGNWQALPSLVYLRGFVLAYAKSLGLDKKEVEQLFWREYGFMDKKAKENLSYKRALGERRVLITPKLIAYSFFSIFLLSIFGYIAYQIMGFAGTPSLVLDSPSNNSVVETDRVDVAGITDNGNVLTVNDETVPVTTSGHFSTNIKLQQGINVIRVETSNRAQKQTSQVVTIEYKPKTAMVMRPVTP